MSSWIRLLVRVLTRGWGSVRLYEQGTGLSLAQVTPSPLHKKPKCGHRTVSLGPYWLRRRSTLIDETSDCTLSGGAFTILGPAIGTEKLGISHPP